MAELENGAVHCSGPVGNTAQDSRDVPDMSPLNHYFFVLLYLADQGTVKMK